MCEKDGVWGMISSLAPLMLPRGVGVTDQSDSCGGVSQPVT